MKTKFIILKGVDEFLCENPKISYGNLTSAIAIRAGRKTIADLRTEEPSYAFTYSGPGQIYWDGFLLKIDESIPDGEIRVEIL